MNQPYDPNIYPLYQQDFYARMTETNNRRREEKKQIRRLGACTGGAVLTYLLIQYPYEDEGGIYLKSLAKKAL